MADYLTVKQLIYLVDTRLLNDAAKNTEVNFHAKKLSGQLLFKLLLLSILDDSKISLRIMEQLFSTGRFKAFAKTEVGETVRFNSISERLSNINKEFFEQMFNQVFQLCRAQLGSDAPSELSLRLFDSTVISTSTKLLRHGMVNGAKDKMGEHSIRQIKFTVGLQDGLPQKVLFFNSQKHLAEDITLREILMQSQFEPNEVAVFDRGLKKRKTFQELKNNNILFVTRINPTTNLKIIKDVSLTTGLQTQSLAIQGDQIIHLYADRKMQLKEPFRLIKAKSLQSNEDIWFITNIEESIPAETITEIYRCRWEIEIFFKFLKQYFHIKHFLSYSENGLQVVMYMSMIAALLVLTFKKKNKIEGYKIAKCRFCEDLNFEITRDIVDICGGNPSASHLFSP